MKSFSLTDITRYNNLKLNKTTVECLSNLVKSAGLDAKAN